MLETREVQLTVESVHRFVIHNTRSDEEAIGIAESMLVEDDDVGEVVEKTVVSSEVVSDPLRLEGESIPVFPTSENGAEWN